VAVSSPKPVPCGDCCVNSSMATPCDIASPLKLFPRAKRAKLSTDLSKCIVCETYNDTEALVIAKTQGIDSLVRASKARNDAVHTRLKDVLGDLSSVYQGDVVISYHRSCFSTYTSKTNLLHAQSSIEPNDIETNATPTRRINTRSVHSLIDLTCCIVCQKKSHKKVTTLHKIETSERILNLERAARDRHDEDMLLKLQNVDMKSGNAVYHLVCLSSYLNSRNIKYSTGFPSNSTVVSSVFDKTFDNLLGEIDNDLMNHNKAFLLSTLFTKYKALLPDGVDYNSYSTPKLQTKLVKHYGDAIVIQSQSGQGKSNIVLNSSVTLGDAVKAAIELKQELRETQQQTIYIATPTHSVNSSMDKYAVLHNAASILRDEMSTVQSLGPSPSEVSQAHSVDLVPPSLALFIQWLMDKHAYESLTSAYEPTQAMKRKSLAVAECILHTSQNSVTPLHIGLAIQLHHECGSRRLIDTLSSYGFCTGYDELRRFMTANAKSEIERIQDGVYIPSGVVSVAAGGSIIQEGADNIDINCETIDGKNTMHSMARIVFQQEPAAHTVRERIRVQYGKEKSLSFTKDTESLM
jgi:hypothetical protein